MGARLSICVVPMADTPSGDLDKVDAEEVEQRLGVQIFSIAGERGRICFRSCGGQRVQSHDRLPTPSPPTSSFNVLYALIV